MHTVWSNGAYRKEKRCGKETTTLPQIAAILSRLILTEKIREVQEKIVALIAE